ncbi:MAG: transglutaminase domain-containing protein [Cyanobacteria bacterium P01_C01_bin.70]
MSPPEHEFPGKMLALSTIRPIGVYALSGLAADGDRLYSIDTLRGYLVAVNPQTNNTVILNPYQLEDKDWMNVGGLSLWQDTFWFARDEAVFWCDRQTLKPTFFAQLPYAVNGVTVWQETVYVSSQKSGYIHRFDRQTGELTGKFRQPGVGPETLAANEAGLWVCDQTEQTVYCLDYSTGAIQRSALTPYSSPTGITFFTPPTGELICYIVYANEEPYIRDDPNSESQYELTCRDRTFIHPLHLYTNQAEHYTLSNGYLVELSYVEELAPLDAVTLDQVEWRVALPATTLRQRVRHVEAIGHPFTLEEQNGQPVAVFRFDQLKPFQGGLVGWKAIVELYSIKYCLTPDDIEVAADRALPADFQRYLVDNDDLAMDTPTIQQAAREGAGTETNVLRKMLKIRNYVYDRLSYGIRPKIDTPDVALERGVGSCGEYVGVLLALARLSGIPCRTIGRYKCPAHPEYRHVPLEPDFNHVWLEFYVPGVGWLPMESNVDDVIERGPYPERFFMGLAWYHTEIGKGIPFSKIHAPNKPEKLSVRDLALNHIRFQILDELIPGETMTTP